MKPDENRLRTKNINTKNRTMRCFLSGRTHLYTHKNAKRGQPTLEIAVFGQAQINSSLVLDWHCNVGLRLTFAGVMSWQAELLFRHSQNIAVSATIGTIRGGFGCCD